MARQSYPSDHVEKALVRFPDGFRALVKKAAQENGRTMNAEIIFQLGKAYGLSKTETGVASTTNSITMGK